MSKVITAYVAPVIGFIVEEVTRVLAPTLEYIGEVFRILFNTVADIFGGIADFSQWCIWYYHRYPYQWYEQDFRRLHWNWRCYREYLVYNLNWIVRFNSSVLKFIWDTIVAIFQGIWDGIVAISRLSENGSQNWNDIPTALAAWPKWLVICSKGLERPQQMYSLQSEPGSVSVGTMLQVCCRYVSSWFGNMFTACYNAVKNAFSSIGSFFSGVWSTVQSIFVNAGQRLVAL